MRGNYAIPHTCAPIFTSTILASVSNKSINVITCCNQRQGMNSKTHGLGFRNSTSPAQQRMVCLYEAVGV